MATETRRNPFQFGSESTILRVFMKIVAVLFIAGVLLYVGMRVTGWSDTRPVERNFVTQPDVNNVESDGVTNFAPPGEQSIAPVPSRPDEARPVNETNPGQ